VQKNEPWGALAFQGLFFEKCIYWMHDEQRGIHALFLGFMVCYAINIFDSFKLKEILKEF
jgi:hypothetical protein